VPDLRSSQFTVSIGLLPCAGQKRRVSDSLAADRTCRYSSLHALHYLRSKLWALIVPQQSPALSTTGKLVALCSWSLRQTSSRDSSLPQHACAERMISSTRTSDARRSSAATLWHTSRSVTTPTTLRLSLFSTTGEQPHPVLRMAIETCCAVSRGVQHESAFTGSILSLQQLISSSPWSSQQHSNESHLSGASEQHLAEEPGLSAVGIDFRLKDDVCTTPAPFVIAFTASH
jgi:hypothetical protein